MRLLLVLLWSSLATAQPVTSNQWSKVNRIRYINSLQKSLEAADSVSVRKIIERVDFSARGACRSKTVSLQVLCLQKMMSDYCKGDANCKRIADLKITNKSNEKSFLSHRERFKILKKNRGKPAATILLDEMQARYGRLAAQFSLTTTYDCRFLDRNCASHDLDKFCKRQNDRGRLTWQSCISAISWFAFSSGRMNELY